MGVPKRIRVIGGRRWVLSQAWRDLIERVHPRYRAEFIDHLRLSGLKILEGEVTLRLAENWYREHYGPDWEDRLAQLYGRDLRREGTKFEVEPQSFNEKYGYKQRDDGLN